MEQQEKVKEVISLCGKRHCEEGKPSAARRGNLLSGLLRHFVPRNDECYNAKSNVVKWLATPLQVERARERVCHENSGNLQSLHNVKHSFTYSPIHLFTSRKRYAFTLAEVLVTLGVIGIVAAMTIPTMINNYQKKVTLTKLQKAYSILYNAVKLSEIDNGNISTWDFKDPENIMNNNIAKYIKHSKVYGSSPSVTPLCHERQVTNTKGYTYSWLDGVWLNSPFTDNNLSVLTNDGICIGYTYNYYTKIPSFFIDINSSINPPNVAGKDLFFFIYDNGKIEPQGYKLSYEDLTNTKVSNSCNIKTVYGGGLCAAKIMKDGWTMKNDYPW